jgi:Spy/CpxP family protein refolding chaperone
MRRKMAIGLLGLMILLAAAIVMRAQDGPPSGPGVGPGEHSWGSGEHRFAGGPGQFDGRADRRDGWQRHRPRDFGGGQFLHLAESPRVRQYLGLSDEQVERLHKIGVEAEKASVQTHADLELRHIELRELLRGDNPDHDAIMQKIDQVNALRGKMEKQRVETMLSARSVLTPEQIKKIKTMRESFRAGGPERGHMMERRGGPEHPGGRPGAPGGSTPKPPEPPGQ